MPKEHEPWSAGNNSADRSPIVRLRAMGGCRRTTPANHAGRLADGGTESNNLGVSWPHAGARARRITDNSDSLYFCHSEYSCRIRANVSFCRRMWMCLSVAAACGCVFLSQPHGDVSFCRIYMGMCLSVAATGGCVFLSQPAGARPARMYVCTSVQPWSRDPSGGKGTQLIGAVCAVGHLRALSPAYQSVTCVGPCPPHSAPMPAMTRVFLSSAFGKLPKAWQVLVDRIRRPPSYPAPKDNPQPPVCWACPLFGSRRPTARSTSKFGTSGSSRFQSSPSRVYRSRDCPFPPFPGPYPPCFRPARIFNATNTPRHHCHTQPTVSLTPLPVPQAASTLPATMPSHASPSPVPQAASTPPATIVLGGLGIVQCARIAGVASHCDY